MTAVMTGLTATRDPGAVEAEHAVERANEPATPAVELRHDAIGRIRPQQRRQDPGHDEQRNDADNDARQARASRHQSRPHRRPPGRAHPVAASRPSPNHFGRAKQAVQAWCQALGETS
jgi:hypothetical protein